MTRKLSGSVLILLAFAGSAAVTAACSSSGGDAPPGGGSGATQGNGGQNPGSGGSQGGSGNGGQNPGNGGDQGNGGTQGDGGGQGAGGGTPANFDDLVNASNPDRNKIPGGQVCERISTIQCAAEATCCSNPGRSYDQCKTTMKQGCISQLYLDAITGNGVSGYDQGRAETIFANYENKARACDTGVTAWGATLDGVRGLVTGTRPTSGDCTPNPYPTADNAAMAPYLASCQDPANWACFPAALKWTCSPRSDSGGPCFTDANCKDALFCTNTKDLKITGGNCVAQKGEGSDCSFPTECQSLLCKSGKCAPVNSDTVFCLQ